MLLDHIYVLFVVIVTQKTWELKGASSIELSDPKKKRKEQINTPFLLFYFLLLCLLSSLKFSCRLFFQIVFVTKQILKVGQEPQKNAKQERPQQKKTFFLEGSGDPHETFPVHCASVTGR